MVIGVLSDSHGYKNKLNAALEQLKDSDIIIHLGDCTSDVNEISKSYSGRIISVKGNCDFTVSVPSDRLEVIEGKRIFITHGHKYGVKYGYSEIKEKAKEVGADIVLFGHTHHSVIFYDYGIFFVNPGSVSLGKDGFNSFAKIIIENGQIKPSILRL